MSQEFHISPPFGFTILFGGLATVLALAGLLLAVWGWKTKRLKYTIMISVMFLIISAVLGFVVISSHMVKISIDNDLIVVKAPIAFINRRIELDSIERVYIVDWDEQKDYYPTLRELGVEFLNYRVGRFTLSNGFSATILATDSKNIVIQTKNGELLLVSPENFDDLLAVIWGLNSSVTKG